jgi:acyl-coenzyme A synthetase/AMP-(fatty) acid ligase
VLPILSEIHGRTREIFSVGDKKYSPAFFEHMLRALQSEKHYLKKFQVIINNNDLEFKIVKGVDYNREIKEKISKYLEDNLGGFFKVRFSYHDDIPRESSGKYSLVKNLT